MGFTVEPEFAATSAAFLHLPPASSPAVGDVQTRRQDFLSHFKPLLNTQFPRLSTVHSKDYWAKSADGHRVPLQWYFKPESSPGSAILFIHSGGLILETHQHSTGLLTNTLINLEYRSSPSNIA